jgi:hypothetical protein
MNREEVLRLAREAEMGFDLAVPGVIEELQTFANLVAAAERDECAKVCEVLANSFEHGAKEWAHADVWDMAEACAMRIRLRGE